MSFQTANTHLYYLVRQDIYEKSRINEYEVSDKLSAYPKRVVKKIKNLLTFLSAGGITWDFLGYCTSYTPELNPSWSVLEYCTYSIVGKGEEPAAYKQFILLVIRLKAPADLFCLKVQKKITKAAKKLEKSKQHNG